MIKEIQVKWYKEHPIPQQSGFMGYCWPILHADHAAGSVGRYEILAVIRPLGHPPIARSVYYGDFELFCKELGDGTHTWRPGLWRIVDFRQWRKDYKWIFEAEYDAYGNILKHHKKMIGTEIEERVDGEEHIIGGEKMTRQPAMQVALDEVPSADSDD